MRFFARALAFLLATLILLGTLVGCAGVLDPLGYWRDSMERTLQESLAGQILSVLIEAVQGGSVALDFGGTDLIDTLPDAAHLKLWFDSQNERVAADAALTLAGEKFEVQAFVSDREAAVISPTFFGSNTLGVDFSALERDLRTSIFSNNSGTAFSVPSISVASASRINAIKKGAFELLGETENTLDTLDEVLDFFLEALSTYATHTRHKEDGCVYISLDIHNDSLSRALRATHEMVADDRSVTKYLQRLAATLDAVTSAATGVSSTAFADGIQYFLHSEADIDELCLAIDQAPPFSFTMETRVRSFGMKVEAFHATLTQDAVKVFDFAMSLAEQGEQNKISLGLGNVQHVLTYCVNADGYREFAADLSYQMSGENGDPVSVVGTLKADKRAKTYTLALHQGEQTCSFSGEYLFEDDETLLSVSESAVGGEKKKLSLTLQLKAEEKTPEMPSHLNVIQMDVARFTPIYTRAVTASAKFYGLWITNGITPHGTLVDVLRMMGAAV